MNKRESRTAAYQHMNEVWKRLQTADWWNDLRSSLNIENLLLYSVRKMWKGEY